MLTRHSANSNPTITDAEPLDGAAEFVCPWLASELYCCANLITLLGRP